MIVVDDGIATGGTVRAAIRSIRAQEPKKVVLAMPVAPPETVAALASEVDRVVCLLTPDYLYAIGARYEDFTQVSDGEVVRLLNRHRQSAVRETSWWSSQRCGQTRLDASLWKPPLFVASSKTNVACASVAPEDPQGAGAARRPELDSDEALAVLPLPSGLHRSTTA